MTFDIPEDVANRLAGELAESDQSTLVTTLLRGRFRRHVSDEELIAACEAANRDPETQEIEREMAALPDTMTEEWNGSFELPKAG